MVLAVVEAEAVAEAAVAMVVAAAGETAASEADAIGIDRSTPPANHSANNPAKPSPPGDGFEDMRTWRIDQRHRVDPGIRAPRTNCRGLVPFRSSHSAGSVARFPPGWMMFDRML
jgi:hypothetical protein